MIESLKYFTPIIFNLSRFVIIAGIPFVIFYLIFPQAFTRHKIQHRVVKLKDITRELIHSSYSLLVFISIAYLVTFTGFREYTQLYFSWEAYPLWWAPLSILCAILIQDTYFYWTHRIIHHPRCYRHFHRVHHQSTNPTPFTSHSFNVLEAILEAMIVPMILLILPMHITALFTYIVISLMYNVYGHLGYEIAPRWFRHSWLFQIMNTSVHHNLHHEKFSGNYGYYFRFWDRLMGTEFPDYVKKYDEVQRKRFPSSAAKKRKVEKALMTVGLLMIGVLPTLKAQSGIVGEWQDTKEKAVIRIYQAEGLYYGRLISSPDPKEQKKIEQHTVMVLREFKETEAGKQYQGTIFQPRFKRYVAGNLELLANGHLAVTGSMAGITRKRIWERL